MKKIFFAIIFVLLVTVGLVFAHEHNFGETKQLIDSGISCDKLADEQLEAIGDYYMEQMHPGEEHETMDEMMGGEGSENLRLMHINMAKMMYCGESRVVGMMPMMNMVGGENMMGYGYWPFSWWGIGFGFIFMILFWGLIIWLIVWLVKKYGSQKNGESAIDILKKRYAMGEISKKEFDDMKKKLME